MSATDKLVKNAKLTLELTSALGMVPIAYGPGGMACTNYPLLVSAAFRNPGFGFIDQLQELVQLAEEFHEIMLKLKELHADHVMTYRLWVCLNHYQSHTGYKIMAPNPEYQSQDLNITSPPIEESYQFLHLLGEVLLSVTPYFHGDSESILRALSILDNRKAQYSGWPFLLRLRFLARNYRGTTGHPIIWCRS